jgi:hypothetical protein
MESSGKQSTQFRGVRATRFWLRRAAASLNPAPSLKLRRSVSRVVERAVPALRFKCSSSARDGADSEGDGHASSS